MGRVKALERTVICKNGRINNCKERLKSVYEMSDGYYGVSLNKNNKTSILKIARLVALHFLPNPNNFPEVNHIDENKANNKASNLEWCTHSYNINYGSRNKKVGDHYIKKVYQYSFDGDLICTFESLSVAAKTLKYSIGDMSIACKNVLKGFSCRGYLFSYEPLTETQLQEAKRIKQLYIKHRSKYENFICLD